MPSKMECVLTSIFHRFGSQKGFILKFKICQNPLKNRSQEASKFRSILGSIFGLSWANLGGQAGGPAVPDTPNTAPRTPQKTDADRHFSTFAAKMIQDQILPIFGRFLVDF